MERSPACSDAQRAASLRRSGAAGRRGSPATLTVGLAWGAGVGALAATAAVVGLACRRRPSTGSEQHAA